MEENPTISAIWELDENTTNAQINPVQNPAHLHQLALNPFFPQLGSLTSGAVLSIMTSDFNLFFEIIDRGPVEIFGYF